MFVISYSCDPGKNGISIASQITEISSKKRTFETWDQATSLSGGSNHLTYTYNSMGTSLST